MSKNPRNIYYVKNEDIYDNKASVITNIILAFSKKKIELKYVENNFKTFLANKRTNNFGFSIKRTNYSRDFIILKQNKTNKKMSYYKFINIY